MMTSETEILWKNTKEALKRIYEAKPGEIVLCPVCEKELHYAISPRNGHVHAKCTTEGCLSFMQ